MSSAARQAGIDGTFFYTPNQIPVEPPYVTIYRDALRTVVAVARTQTEEASPSVFVCRYPASLDAGVYYLSFEVLLTSGGTPFVDNDDTLVLTTVQGAVSGSALVTLESYRTITLDTTSTDSAVTGALVEAQQLVEEYLDRELDLAERTESLVIRPNGKVYPKAVPILSAPTLTIEGYGIAGVTAEDAVLNLEPSNWSQMRPPRATVTYQGGYTTSTLPATLARRIALIARRLLQESLVMVPAGATAVSQGDSSISFGPSGASDYELSADDKRVLRRYRRPRV